MRLPVQMSVKTSDRIVVTGGAGFLGSFVVEKLKARGYTNLVVPRRREYDLTREARRRAALRRASSPTSSCTWRPRSAASARTATTPAGTSSPTWRWGCTSSRARASTALKKFVQVGTICAYPNLTPVPFKEADLWNGYPEVTNAPYGVAKKALLVMCQALPPAVRAQRASTCCRSTSTARATTSTCTSSHVIPALIRKCVEARDRGDEEIPAWGTGSASREFLYVEDCAEGIVAAMEKYDSPEPMNLGSGREITIKDLTELVAKLCRASRARSSGTRPSRTASRGGAWTSRRAKERLGFRRRDVAGRRAAEDDRVVRSSTPTGRTSISPSVRSKRMAGPECRRT